MSHHHANKFLNQLSSLSSGLRSSDVQDLKISLDHDYHNYLFNGLIAIGSALQAIMRNNYGWAVVKFYYSAFYLCRAKLAQDGIAIFYPNKAAHSIESIIGAKAVKIKGQTHEAVITAFIKYNKNNILLSQKIEEKEILIWLKEQREFHNYKLASMLDPSPCQGLKLLNGSTIRTYIGYYLDDDKGSYYFDADHAVAAWPLKLLDIIISNSQSKAKYSNDKKAFILNLFKDQSGTLTPIWNTSKELFP